MVQSTAVLFGLKLHIVVRYRNGRLISQMSKLTVTTMNRVTLLVYIMVKSNLENTDYFTVSVDLISKFIKTI